VTSSGLPPRELSVFINLVEGHPGFHKRGFSIDRAGRYTGAFDVDGKCEKREDRRDAGFSTMEAQHSGGKELATVSIACIGPALLDYKGDSHRCSWKCQRQTCQAHQNQVFCRHVSRSHIVQRRQNHVFANYRRESRTSQDAQKRQRAFFRPHCVPNPKIAEIHLLRHCRDRDVMFGRRDTEHKAMEVYRYYRSLRDSLSDSRLESLESLESLKSLESLESLKSLKSFRSTPLS